VSKTAETKAQRDQQIVLMRGLGCTLIDIAHETGLSVATIKRVLSRHKTIKGSLCSEALAEARKRVLASSANDENLRLLTATTVRSALVLTDRIQVEALATLDVLNKDPHAALIRARALGSLSNVVKLNADGLRSAVKIAPQSEGDPDEELPEIVVRELTDDDVAEIRRQQEQEDIAMGLAPAEVDQSEMSHE
tara:strand:+ start:15965 stop:16543 length:579 start_codon:yes stop_codon:yes gene_type:complete